MSENIVGPGSSYGGQAVVTYVGSPSVIDDVAVFADTSGLRIKDSLVSMSSKLNRSGDLPMTGDLDMAHFDTKNTGNIRPRDTNDSDIGTSSKRYKTIYYTSLDPAPAGVASVVAANGFGASAGPALTLTVTPVGVLKSNGTSLALATAPDITSYALTGFVSGAGSVDSKDSLLGALEKLDGNDSLALLKTGGAMSGPIAMATQNITNVGSISGATISRTADSICGVNGTPLGGDIAFFNTGLNTRTIQSAGIVYTDVVTNTGGVVTSGNLPSFSGVTGRLLADSTVAATSVVVGPVSAVNDRVAVFSGTTGKLLADGGAALSAYAPLAGAVFIGGVKVRTSEPVSCGKLIQTATSALVNNTTAENSWFGGGAATVGSRVFAAGSGPGTTVRFTGWAYMAVSSGTLTVRLKNTSGTLITHVITPPAGSQQVGFDIVCTYQSGTAAVSYSKITYPVIVATTQTFTYGSTGTWDTSVAQTFDVTWQFSIADGANGISTSMGILETIFET